MPDTPAFDGSGFSHEQIPTNGIELHVATAGPADGPPVVLCHGFPELWYSWRHQLGPRPMPGTAPSPPTCAATGAAAAPPRSPTTARTT